MPRRLLVAILTVAALLAAAEPAVAWGPATHIALGTSILERLALLPAAMAALLGRHGVAFLYGNIAADVVFAKRLSRIKQFCHHWSTAYRLLDSARSPTDQAFAYGYLAHLAADTVAHGKYVPRQIVVSRSTVGFGHLYWELRADAAQTPATWRRLDEITRYKHDDHHRCLERHIFDTFLPYAVNRRLFERLNSLTLRPGFRRGVHVWSRCSRWYLPSSLLEGYHAESIERIVSVLSQGQRSPVIREDPNGTSALMQVRVHRREVRRLSREGAPVRHRVLEASRGLAPGRVPEEVGSVMPVADQAADPWPRPLVLAEA